MATMSLRYEFLSQYWRDIVQPFIYNLIYPRAKQICEEVTAVERAIRALQLAANPGETYEIVSARIDREAARYRSFLKKPERIGKIAWNVRQLNSKGSTNRVLYYVNDPSEGKKDRAEGRASFSYKSKRASNVIHEFVVYDEQDAPLFPIARTYSNWIGSKKFELGLNRTFYLDLIEDEPGYVKVHAGFVPPVLDRSPQVDEFSPYPPRRRRFPAISISPIGMVSFAAIAILVVGGLILRTTMAKSTGSSQSVKPSASSLNVFRPGNVDVSAISNGISPAVTQTLVVEVRPPLKHVKAKREMTARAQLLLKGTQLQAVEQVSVSVDDSLCKDKEEQCREMWSNVEKGMQSKFGSLAALVDPDNREKAGPVVRLVVSYQPVDWERGHVFFRVYDSKEGLWDGSHEFDCGAKDRSVWVKAFCSETQWQIFSELTSAKTASGATEVEQLGTLSTQ